MSAPANTPTAYDLFKASLRIGTLSIGGGVSAWLLREYVTKNRWLPEREFLNDFALARVLPGTNVTNMTVIAGFRLLGIKGAAAGFFGLIVGPFVLLIAMVNLFDRLNGPALDAALQGAAAGAIGPVVYLAIKSVQHSGTEWYSILVLAGTTAAVVLKMPLLPVVAVSLAASLVLVRLFWRP